MNKILLTGFDPFGGESLNPSYEAVKLLNGKLIFNTEIVTTVLPTVFNKSSQILIEQIELHQPSAVICVGQAGGRSEINLERVAINLNNANIPDNEGNKPEEELISQFGPAAYFSNLPLKLICANLKQAGIPTAISQTAGTFVCNHVFYSLMEYVSQQDSSLLAGFVHIPFLPEQIIKHSGMASMSLDLVVNALSIIVESTVNKRT